MTIILKKDFVKQIYIFYPDLGNTLKKNGFVLYNLHEENVMNRIKHLRIEKGWQQKELADKLHVKANTISRYENEQLGLDADLIINLCNVFGCTADYLLCRSDTPSPKISEDEAALLRAYRAADDHTKAVVRLALEPFSAAGHRTQVS